VCLSVRGEPAPPRRDSAKRVRQLTPPTKGCHSESANWCPPTLPAGNLPIIAPECVYRSGVNPHRRRGSPPSRSANSHRQTTPPNDTAKRHRQPLSIKRKPGSRRLSHVSSLMSPAANRSRRKSTPPDHTAKQVRQTTPPTDTANGHRQRTPPTDTANGHRQRTPPVRHRQSDTASQSAVLRERQLVSADATRPEPPIIAPECVYRSGVNPHRRRGSPPNRSANSHRQLTPPNDTANRRRLRGSPGAGDFRM
jgi:hypothetical protein